MWRGGAEARGRGGAGARRRVITVQSFVVGKGTGSSEVGPEVWCKVE